MAFAFISCDFILDLRVDGKVAYFISEDYLNCWMLKAALCKKKKNDYSSEWKSMLKWYKPIITVSASES